jgi:hypothetical protein
VSAAAAAPPPAVAIALSAGVAAFALLPKIAETMLPKMLMIPLRYDARPRRLSPKPQ